MSKVKSEPLNKFSGFNFLYKNKDTYDYVNIICPIHGEFSTTFNNHFKNGCKLCYYDSKDFKYKQDDVIIFLKEIHNDRYDYSKFVYNGNRKKSTVICKIHGEFFIKIKDHKKGVGCSLCNKSKGEIKIEDYLKKEKY